MNIRPMEAKLFHANGRTDMTKLTVALHKFANSPKNHENFNQDSNLANI
jgi:hypothetical protein